MAQELTRVTYTKHYLGRYYAEVVLTRWYKGTPHGEFKFTFYHYYFNDAYLFDELMSDDTSKKRKMELVRFVRNNAQYIMRHNDDEFKKVTP